MMMQKAPFHQGRRHHNAHAFLYPLYSNQNGEASQEEEDQQKKCYQKDQARCC